MNIDGIIFDINGTLIDIQTDEGNEEIYRGISHFLTYHDIYLHRWQVRDAYFRIMDIQRNAGGEEHAEFDVVSVWEAFLREYSKTPLSPAKAKQLSCFLSEMYRGISRNRLQLYPGVKAVLEELSPRYRLAALSDAQRIWAVPEMKALRIDTYFSPVIISSDYGYRKPDRRIFETALSRLRMKPERVLFVGNDMYRDIFGAKRLGMKTVLFLSSPGRTEWQGVEPDYIIYNFSELRQAVAFFEAR